MANRDNLKTALIIGRWQPWHKGHRELFKAALERAEQVAIGVRATHNTDGSNPFSFDEVKNVIDCAKKKSKDSLFLKYEIEEIVLTCFDYSHIQDRYFVIDSMDHLYQSFLKNKELFYFEG